MESRLKTYYESLSINDLRTEIKRIGKCVESAKRKVDRSCLSLADLPARKGVRGGRNTSQQAKHQANLDNLVDFENYLRIAQSVMKEHSKTILN